MDWVVIASVCAVGLVGALFIVLGPAPPTSIAMASGPSGGAYHAIALRYAEAFRRVGIRLNLVATDGAAENLELITAARSRVDIALIQGGLISNSGARGLTSVGQIAYEPIWIFYKLPQPVRTLSAFKGKRIAIGSPKSGTNDLARRILELNGVGPNDTQLIETNFEDSELALAAGSIDAVVIVAAETSSIVRRLLRDRDTRLFSFERAQGYAKHFSYLHPLVLHRGSIDLRNNVPAEDVALVATSTSLVVRASLHPAIVYLLAESAADFHRKPGLFEGAGEFPKAIDPELPSAEAAERYYRHGVPFLHRNFPFWIADFIERAWLLLAPLAAVVLTLFKLVPMAHRWSIDQRVLDWYVRLQVIEDKLAIARSSAEAQALGLALDVLDAEVLASPAMTLGNRAFEVREHIAVVRERINAPRS